MYVWVLIAVGKVAFLFEVSLGWAALSVHRSPPPTALLKEREATGGREAGRGKTREITLKSAPNAAELMSVAKLWVWPEDALVRSVQNTKSWVAPSGIQA